MSQTKMHQGGCHCGAVRYSVEVDLSQPVLQCNCSICFRTGTLLTFVPENAFKLEKGENVLTDYQFDKKTIHHLFCKVCGVRSFGRGNGPQGPMVAVNARCLDGLSLEDLQLMNYDGRSR